MNVNMYRGDLQACRVCLATDIKLISLQDFPLKRTYSEFSGVPIMATDGLPQHVCVFCCALLKKSSEFRNKCKASYNLLLGHLLDTQVLTSSYIENIDRSHLRIHLNTTDVLQCNCLPDETCSTHEDGLCETEPTSDIETADVENSSIDNDASFENKDTESKVKPVEQIINERFVMKCIRKHDYIDNSTRIETQSNDLKRIEDFKSKHFNKVMDSDKEAFYHYIFKKYLARTGMEKNNDLIKETSSLNSTEDFEFISTEDNCDAEKSRPQVKDSIELCNINQNVTRKRFYEYISSIYIDKNTSLTKRKIVKDIERMKGIKNRNGTITRESLEILSKELNFDLILMHKEEKIQDVLNRKESDKYKRAKYKCEQCFIGFATENTFQNHKATHDPKLPQECEFCHQRFKKPRTLKDHLSRAHKYKFVCRQCGQVKRSSNLAREHYKSHSGFNYVCEHCGATFDKHAARLNHLRIHHGNVSCDICHMKFTGEAGLSLHKIKAHKECSSANALLRHAQVTAGDCGTHIRPCTKCGESFTEADLSQHMENHSEFKRLKNSRLMFRCSSCLVQFHNANALLRHAQVTAGDCGTHIRPCTKCGESFTEADHFDHMIEKHADENKRLRRETRSGQSCQRRQKTVKKPITPITYMCEFCGKDGFKHESLLRGHQQTHSDVRSVECDVCKKRFKNKYQLGIHIRIHTDERRYKCRRCLKAFRQHAHLVCHMKSHTNEKPFACEICQKQFKYNASLAEHTRTVHEGKPPRKRMRRDK